MTLWSRGLAKLHDKLDTALVPIAIKLGRVGSDLPFHIALESRDKSKILYL